MSLSEKSIEELRQILQKDIGKSVDNQQAKRVGKFLLQLYSHLSGTKKI